jgi:hypothetical protein
VKANNPHRQRLNQECCAFQTTERRTGWHLRFSSDIKRSRCRRRRCNTVKTSGQLLSWGARSPEPPGPGHAMRPSPGLEATLSRRPVRVCRPPRLVIGKIGSSNGQLKHNNNDNNSPDISQRHGQPPRLVCSEDDQLCGRPPTGAALWLTIEKLQENFHPDH